MERSASYEERACAPALEEFVECVWWARGHGGDATVVLPDGCVDLLIHRDRSGGLHRRTHVVGTMRRARVVTQPADYEILAVRFRPGGARALLPIDVAAAVDERVPFRAESSWVGALDACWRETEASDAASALEHQLLRGLPDVVDRDRERLRSAELCLTRPDLSVSEIAESLGVSRQHLRRRVVAATGLGPKLLARIGRFRRLAERVAGGETPSAGLAVEAGYCDQAHMANEFRALAGTTPGAYARFHSSKTGPSPAPSFGP